MSTILNTVVKLLSKYALPLCAALAAVCVMLFVLFIKQLRKVKRLGKELTHQQERVLARKNKIMQLKQLVRHVRGKQLEAEAKLLNSYSAEELNASYEDVAKELKETGVHVHKGLQIATDQDDFEHFDQILIHLQLLAVKLQHAFHAAEPVELKPPEEEKKEEAVAAADVVAAKRSAMKRRVLVAEDNEVNMRTAVEILETNGFIVDKAENGEEALEKYNLSRDGMYSMILLDIVMPGKGGYDVSREIRKGCRGDSERIPIIAMTANDFVEDLVQIQDAGMNDRAVKPLTEESLLGVVRKWLDGDRKKDRGDNSWAKVLTAVKTEDKTEDKPAAEEKPMLAPAFRKEESKPVTAQTVASTEAKTEASADVKTDAPAPIEAPADTSAAVFAPEAVTAAVQEDEPAEASAVQTDPSGTMPQEMPQQEEAFAEEDADEREELAEEEEEPVLPIFPSEGSKPDEDLVGRLRSKLPVFSTLPAQSDEPQQPAQSAHSFAYPKKPKVVTMPVMTAILNDTDALARDVDAEMERSDTFASRPQPACQPSAMPMMPNAASQTYPAGWVNQPMVPYTPSTMPYANPYGTMPYPPQQPMDYPNMYQNPAAAETEAMVQQLRRELEEQQRRHEEEMRRLEQQAQLRQLAVTRPSERKAAPTASGGKKPQPVRTAKKQQNRSDRNKAIR